MFMYNIVLTTFAISLAVGAVVTNLASSTSCRVSEFTCQDGTCISTVSVCNGNWDCADGSDEVFCYSSANLNLTEAEVPHWRSKRQAQCGSYRWRCADGTCIPVDGRCDGKFDCLDKSDESHALCRNNKCQRNWFRCTYGACVDGTAPCNGVSECVDNSDELLPRCRNQSRVINGKFRCLDGNEISGLDACDGTPNCPDGSDETVAACAGQKCPVHLFQCAYGACVDQGSDCNGRKDCADSSDESAELCNRMLPAVNTPSPAVTNSPATSGCLLPEYPAHGSYVVTNSPQSRPRQRLPFALLKITCDEGYGVVGDTEDTLVYCDGNFTGNLPKCVRYCKLEPHISVQYNCRITIGVGVRPCKEYEPPGTSVTPECKPNYFSNDNIFYMKCYENGDWNRIVTCEPECGLVTPNGTGLIYGGKETKRGELPWYVAIYRKPIKIGTIHKLICGGSIVSNKITISAAHCFYNAFAAPNASHFAVATAKLYREWNHEEDKDAQKSDLISIHVTDHYFGPNGNQQDDIAILVLESPFKYYYYVRRVCLDFSRRFSEQQLQEGNLGKVAGFGLTTAQDGSSGSPVLKSVSLPYVPIRQCRKLTPESFTENLTGDKICAGYPDGSAGLCKGDSGGGLAFPAPDRAFTRYFLRGIVSTAPQSQDKCNTYTVITFTSIIKHEDFIKQFL